MIPDINLLPKLDQKAQSSKVVYVLMAVVSVLALGVFAYMYVDASTSIVDLKAQEQSLTTEQTKLQATYDSLQKMEAGSLEESLAFIERISYPVTPLIDESQKLLKDTAYLRSYNFSANGVTIIADFEMLSDVSNYVEALNGSDYFMDVQVTDVENFEVNPTEEEQTDKEKFQQVPRYTVAINLLMDSMSLVSGGGSQ